MVENEVPHSHQDLDMQRTGEYRYEPVEADQGEASCKCQGGGVGGGLQRRDVRPAGGQQK